MSEIDKFFKETGWTGITNQLGVRKDDKRGSGWEFKSVGELLRAYKKWQKKQ